MTLGFCSSGSHIPILESIGTPDLEASVYPTQDLVYAKQTLADLYY